MVERAVSRRSGNEAKRRLLTESAERTVERMKRTEERLRVLHGNRNRSEAEEIENTLLNLELEQLTESADVLHRAMSHT